MCMYVGTCLFEDERIGHVGTQYGFGDERKIRLDISPSMYMF